ncbi:hypothetical protein C463_10910 [Halorubrum californiense DSM 19288]|uniref:Uncharacterized protein n=1 Tax=Halorubrum californiense DSM 19288 TaxID=1227465 RepID=M0E627_9EURY|nr:MULTISPECIES: hypothetical protein [Halorubrum]ELZ42377.1 hypothetical protein C463_10910 [Halorubrum californiense DSM 19288]TKX66909.1 hypothetical protein EXE40_15550 [Halorubrum sp. GN11GM_10-3_MGM]
MTWHAVDALDRAVDATRRFLFPFEAVRWAKIAFLALVMAGGGAGVSGSGSSSFGASAAGVGARNEFVPAESESVPAGVERVVGAGVERLTGLDAALLAGIAVGAALVAVGLAACSIAFRLVFYDALATTEVALWRPFRDRLRQALELLAFSVVLAAAAGVPALALALVLDPAASVAVGDGVSFGGLSGSSTIQTAAIGALAVVAAGSILLGAVGSRLTFEFVAPAMVTRDAGVIAGWRAVWESLRGSGTDVVAYFAVHAVVAAGVGIVQGVAVALAAGVVAAVGLVALVLAAIPLGGVGALIGTTGGAIVLATVLVCGVVAVVVVTLPIRLVARTYLTAYEVSTLAGIDSDLAPLASTLVASDGAVTE